MSQDRTRTIPLELLFPPSAELPVVAYEKNQLLFSKGDIAKSLYLVRKGMVEHFITSRHGEKLVYDFVTPHHPVLLGIEALDTSRRPPIYETTAEAKQDTQLQKIPASYIEERMMSGDFDFTMALLQQLTFSTKNRLQRVERRYYCGYPDRMMLGLDDLAATTSEDRQVCNLSQQDIAHYLGMPRQTVSRHLGYLKNRRLLEHKGYQEYVIIDPQK